MNIEKIFTVLLSPVELIEACLAEGDTGMATVNEYIDTFIDEESRSIVRFSIENFFEVVENPVAIAKAYWLIKSVLAHALNASKFEVIYEDILLLQWYKKEYYEVRSHIKFGLYYDSHIDTVPVIDISVGDALLIHRTMNLRFETFALCHRSKRMTYLHLKGFSEAEVKKLAKENLSHIYF